MANLINGLGGVAGFGEYSLVANDDESTDAVDITSVFGADGITFFDQKYTNVFINNNGNITFENNNGSFTPTPMEDIGFPIIAAFFTDVDTSGGTVLAIPGGTSTGSNLVWYDLDVNTHTLTVTWDDVGYFSYGTDKSNAFQMQLTENNDCVTVELRYEAINWTKTDYSEIAEIGYSSGDGKHSFELPQSGNADELFKLPTTIGDTGEAGVYHFSLCGDCGLVKDNTPAVLIDGIEDTDYIIKTTDLVQGFSDVAGATLSVASLIADHGILVATSGGFSFTPDANYNGIVNLSYDVIDDKGCSLKATQSFQLAAVLDPPELTGTPATLVHGTEDIVYTIKTADLLQGFTDVDGDNLDISNLKVDNNGTLDGLTFTPNTNYNGVVNLTYDVTDGRGGAVPATQNFVLHAVIDSPTISGIATVGETLSIDNHTDIADNVITTAYQWLADGVVIGTNSDTYTLTPAESDKIITINVSYVDQNGIGSTFSIETERVGQVISGSGVLEGGRGSDIITGSNRSDSLSGGEGSDVLNAGNGNNSVSGGEGNDAITAGVGSDTLDGGVGDDALFAGDGNNGVAGGEGNDAITAGVGDDALDGGVGDDALYAGDGNNTVAGGEGNDVVTSGVGNDTLDGGTGDDTLFADEGNNAVSGGEGNDVVISGIGDDTLDGGTGDDNLVAGDGNNTVAGGEGDDAITAGIGSDTLDGGVGDDTLYAGDGDDVVDGGDGDDVIIGGFGNGDDEYIGGSGIDTVKFTSAFNTITVKLVMPTLPDPKGFAIGDDIGADLLINIENITGGQASDNLTGDERANELDGYLGNDIIRGGNGNDTLTGGAGKDVLVGGTGADVFKFNNVEESGATATTCDIIRFFKLEDKIDLSAIDANSTLLNEAFTPIQNGLSNFALNSPGQLHFDTNAHILYGNTDSDALAEFAICLQGVNSLSLSPSNFIL